MTTKKPQLRIGTSGYQYLHWKHVFYPDKLTRKEWFTYYTKYFDTVEINNTFYKLPESHIFSTWHDLAPVNFLYSLKFSRYGSHLKCLKEPKKTISLFTERARLLRPFLGPILVQLRPGWDFNPGRLDEFLRNTSKDFRWVVEFRDRRWLREETYCILKQYNAGLCIHDLVPGHPQRATADWVYLRFHGDHYRGSYSKQALQRIAERVKEFLRDNLDVYVYFNNDENGYAVSNALSLKELLLF